MMRQWNEKRAYGLPDTRWALDTTQSQRLRGPSLRLGVGFAVAMLTGAALVWSGSNVANAQSAPFSFADLAEKLSPAVVNISTTQEVKTSSNRRQDVPVPQFPPGSPFEEFFKEFFERQDRDRGDRGDRGTTRRRTTSGRSGSSRLTCRHSYRPPSTLRRPCVPRWISAAICNSYTRPLRPRT